MAGEEAQQFSPQPAVNNFVAAKELAARFGWRCQMVFTIRVHWFFRTGGPGLLTISRSNDFELYRPARRAGLGPLTTTPEGVADYLTTLLYCRRWVKPRGRTFTSKPKAKHEHR